MNSLCALLILYGLTGLFNAVLVLDCREVARDRRWCMAACALIAWPVFVRELLR